MADATRFSVMSKQIEDNKQATDDLRSQMADLAKSQADACKSLSHMDAMLSMLVSQSKGQTSHAPVLNASPSDILNTYPRPPQPPDPPDLVKLFESPLLHTPAIHPRAPFSPNQNQNNQGLTDEIGFDRDNTAWLLNGLVTQRSKIELEVESFEIGSSIQQIESSGVKDVLSTNLILSNGSNPEEESRPKETSTHKADSDFGEETITSNASNSSQVPSQVSLYHLPVFDGTLPDCWIEEVDRFFELEQYGNEEKLDLISLSVEGAALKWFRRHRREFTDWTYIKRKLMARFGLVKGCSPPEVLPEEKLITKVDQDTDFGSEKESSNSVEITSIKGHEVKGTTVSHSATYCAKQIHQNEEFPHLHVTDSTSKLSRNLSLIMHQVDNSVLENQKKLARKAEIPVFENLHEPSRLFDDESQGILGDHTLVPMKPYQSYSQSWYELDTIQSDINFKVLVAHECDMVGVVVIYEVATTFEKLAKTWKFKFKGNPERSKLLDDMFSFMEKSSEKYVMVRESHHRLLESQQSNGLSLLNCLIAHDVLRLSSSEYTKHTLILVYHLCSLSSSRLFMKTYAGCIVALLMIYDAERLFQSNAPPIFSDLLCVKNIRVRLKMVLLLEFLWLILFTSKMFKSSNVHQNKNQTDQKLSSYWKLLLRLLHPLHINRWKSFYLLVIKPLFKGKEESASFNVAVTSCSSYVKVLELIKDRDSRKRKLGKNWWFKFKLNIWISENLHLWRKRKSEKLQRASKHVMCDLNQNSWDMSIFGKSRTWLLCKMRIVRDLKDLRQFTRAGIKFHLKHKNASSVEAFLSSRWKKSLPKLEGVYYIIHVMSYTETIINMDVVLFFMLSMDKNG